MKTLHAFGFGIILGAFIVFFWPQLRSWVLAPLWAFIKGKLNRK